MPKGLFVLQPSCLVVLTTLLFALALKNQVSDKSSAESRFLPEHRLVRREALSAGSL
jgi:hypothetical protein